MRHSSSSGLFLIFCGMFLFPLEVRAQQGSIEVYVDSHRGNPTSSGELYDPSGFTAAHAVLPVGTVLRVTNSSTGQAVDVRVNDRKGMDGRLVYISGAAGRRVGLAPGQASQGHVQVLAPSPGQRGAASANPFKEARLNAQQNMNAHRQAFQQQRQQAKVGWFQRKGALRNGMTPSAQGTVGYFFSLSENLRVQGSKGPSYPLVRVWGTVGFIVPSLILFVPLSRGAPASAILPCAVFFCLLSLANSFTLPRIDRPSTRSDRLPTREALKAIFSPEARWLSIGLFFGFLAAAAYYAFIGNYLDEVVKIPKRFIGLIINLGVALEIGFTVAMPWLQQRIRLKGVLVAGLACMAGRLILLTFFPTPAIAVAVQVFHGLEVLALYIGPVMFLDRLARDEFRNSIQGVFTMVIGGVSRVIGGLLAGAVVMNFDLKGGLIYGAAMATISFLILAFLFSRIPRRGEIEVSPEQAS